MSCGPLIPGKLMSTPGHGDTDASVYVPGEKCRSFIDLAPASEKGE